MNIFTICRKELNTYFRSPIAYGVMVFFALIAGYFFSFATAAFVRQGLQSAMMGQSQPMDVNEYVIRNLL
jgi:ABC-type transport system involved in multi-copper enzyme maturation permease subunit